MNCANLLENIGYACAPRANGALRVWSPFTFDDGEHLGVFLEPSGDGQWLVTDHADALMHASAHGANITKSKLNRIRQRFDKVAITEGGALSAVATQDTLPDVVTNVLNTAIAISHLESTWRPKDHPGDEEVGKAVTLLSYTAMVLLYSHRAQWLGRFRPAKVL